MRIPTLQKIEAQAEAYSNAHKVVMSKEWHDERDALRKELVPLIEEWNKVENTCDGVRGGICTCKEHPLYVSLYLEQIRPISRRLNELAEQEVDAQRIVFHSYKLKLLEAKKAKEKYE